MPSNENAAVGQGSARKTSYPPGIHVPSLTFFDASPEQQIDWDTQAKHMSFLVESGVHGIVVAGTNGEAVALSREEKAQLVVLARRVAQQSGRPSLSITMGTNPSGATRDVIQDCLAAKAAGADFVLVLVPAFFHFAMSKEAICAFFEEVADSSPVPLLLYNFPGVAAGLNLDSDMLDRLAKHRNIVGAKLTCGGIAKVTRVAASHSPKDFAALAGQSDWLVPALSVGSTGCITGVGNLYPKVCIAIYELYKNGDLAEAQRLQLELGKMELGFGDGGINGTKWVVAELLGYPTESRDCRRPYPRFEDAKRQQWILHTVRGLAIEESRVALSEGQ